MCSVYVYVCALQPTIQQFNNIKLLLELLTLAYCRCHSTFNFRRQNGTLVVPSDHSSQVKKTNHPVIL